MTNVANLVLTNEAEVVLLETKRVDNGKSEFMLPSAVIATFQEANPERILPEALSLHGFNIAFENRDPDAYIPLPEGIAKGNPYKIHQLNKVWLLFDEDLQAVLPQKNRKHYQIFDSSALPEGIREEDKYILQTVFSAYQDCVLPLDMRGTSLSDMQYAVEQYYHWAIKFVKCVLHFENNQKIVRFIEDMEKAVKLIQLKPEILLMREFSETLQGTADMLNNLKSLLPDNDVGTVVVIVDIYNARREILRLFQRVFDYFEQHQSATVYAENSLGSKGRK